MTKDARCTMLLFRARDRRCALPIAHVAEILRPLPLSTLRAMPGFVAGVARIRGAPTPVLDIGALLGEGAGSGFTRFVLLRDRPVALGVEAVDGVRALDQSGEPLPPLLRDAGSDALTALRSLDAELLHLLELARALTDPLVAALEAEAAA